MAAVNAPTPKRDGGGVNLPPVRRSDLLAGRIAVVTGGGRGIGVAIACMLADTGAHVVVAGRNPASLQQTVDIIRGRGGIAAAHRCDMSQSEQALDLVRACGTFFGPVDVLVNNAGVAARETADGVPPDVFDQIYSTNVRGPYYAMLGAGRYMPDGGSIITIGSVVATVPDVDLAAYAASKAAVRSLTMSFATRLGPRHIRVNAVAPGYLDSPLNRDRIADPVRAARVVNRTALGRWGQPADAADVVCFLASDRAAFITGQSISVNGGFPFAAPPEHAGASAPENRGDGS